MSEKKLYDLTLCADGVTRACEIVNGQIIDPSFNSTFNKISFLRLKEKLMIILIVIINRNMIVMLIYLTLVVKVFMQER